jgi:hypothetical protein
VAGYVDGKGGQALRRIALVAVRASFGCPGVARALRRRLDIRLGWSASSEAGQTCLVPGCLPAPHGFRHRVVAARGRSFVVKAGLALLRRCFAHHDCPRSRACCCVCLASSPSGGVAGTGTAGLSPRLVSVIVGRPVSSETRHTSIPLTRACLGLGPFLLLSFG